MKYCALAATVVASLATSTFAATVVLDGGTIADASSPSTTIAKDGLTFGIVAGGTFTEFGLDSNYNAGLGMYPESNPTTTPEVSAQYDQSIEFTLFNPDYEITRIYFGRLYNPHNTVEITLDNDTPFTASLTKYEAYPQYYYYLDLASFGDFTSITAAAKNNDEFSVYGFDVEYIDGNAPVAAPTPSAAFAGLLGLASLAARRRS